jgi:hypothetical protein
MQKEAEFSNNHEQPNRIIVSKSEMIKHLIKENLDNEMAKALIKIYETPYKTIKILLIFVTVSTTALSSYLVIESVLSYFDYEVSTTLRTVYETPTLFPQIKICNVNPFTTEESFEYLKNINKAYFPETDIFNESQMNNLSYEDRRKLVWRIYLLATGKMNSFNFSIEEKKKLGHSIEEKLLVCKYNNQMCTSNDFVWTFDRLYGNCFIFNSNSSNRISIIAGSWYGLKMSIYVNYHQQLKVFNSLFGYGAHIRIGNRSYLTDDTFDEILLSPGYITSVSVDRSFKFLLAKPYSQCDIDNAHRAFSSKFYNIIYHSKYEYTQQLCLFTCYQSELIKVCDCSDPWFISLFDKDVCETNNQTECLLKVYINTYLPEHSDFLNKYCLINCPLECNRTEYKYTIASNQLDPTWFSDFILKRPNISKDFMNKTIDMNKVRESVVSLNVYYNSLSYTLATESPKLDIISLLSNIGGSLGLFMGVSFLSLVEILVLLLDIAFFVLKRN